MTDKEIYEKYLELSSQEGITKKEIAIKLGFDGVKRPDLKLNKWLKEYQSKLENITHDTSKEMAIIKGEKESAILSVGHNFFNNEENISLLMEVIEEQRKKKKGDSDQLEIIDTNLPMKYKDIKNVQKSIRVNPSLFKEWEKQLRKNYNFKNIPQSQLLNITLLHMIEKFK